MPKKRNYRKEYDEFQGTEVQKKNRAKRNSARKKLNGKKGDGMEIDHKIPLAKGGSNSKSNLRKVTRKTNRKKGKK